MYFCGFHVSLTLAMPWALFYTRALYWYMAYHRKQDGRERVRLIHQSIRDLQKWKCLSAQKLGGTPMLPTFPTASVHTDATDVGYGGTINLTYVFPVIQGQHQIQGIWACRDCAESITYRELKAIRLLRSGKLGKVLLDMETKYLLLHVDSQAVVHIINLLVSYSRPMIR